MHDPASRVLAIRARTILSLAGEVPARGARLFAPLKKMDNAVLLVRDGLVEEVRPWAAGHLPPGTEVRDVGPVCLAPAVVNAHTHIQLSWLAGQTLWHKGFAAWLGSLIPLLRSGQAETVAQAITEACEGVAAMGTCHLGDVGGSLRGSVSCVQAACRAAQIEVTHFCEWFGYGPPFTDDLFPWPQHCRQEIENNPALAADCAPAGHALYSTGPTVLQAAHRFCMEQGRPFSFHLAESPEETELLTSGQGPLHSCYAGSVLPEGWQPPGLRPLAYAASLGLLGRGSLAVHGVQLDAQEVDVLAASGTALCLCPRSNRNLAVGTAPVRALLESGALLCLGTDGLTSNSDLDVRQEAVYLREHMDIPPEALVRMLTINGATALGLAGSVGSLAPGVPARFCLLPEALTY